MSALKVAVIAGGPSAEANVSRSSAKAVCEALSSAGHDPTQLELDRGLAEQLLRGSYDVAFPTTHGPLGEDGCLQGLLEVCGVPYVGSGVLASALAAHKPHAKAFFATAGLPTPAGLVVRSGAELDREITRARSELGAAVIVKPASGGSAIATSRIAAGAPDAEVLAALEAVFRVDDAALIERFVVGEEVTCGVLEDDAGRPRALSPTLVVSQAADWYDFKSRYQSGGSKHHCPAPLAPVLIERIQRTAIAAHVALGARDLSRADFLVREPDEAVLLEVNTLPGMTSTSLFPEAAAVAGTPFDHLCDQLARRAHARPPRLSVAALEMP